MPASAQTFGFPRLRDGTLVLSSPGLAQARHGNSVSDPHFSHPTSNHLSILSASWQGQSPDLLRSGPLCPPSPLRPPGLPRKQSQPRPQSAGALCDLPTLLRPCLLPASHGSSKIGCPAALQAHVIALATHSPPGAPGFLPPFSDLNSSATFSVAQP